MTDFTKKHLSVFITNAVIWGAFFALGALALAALVVRDYKYIVDHPWAFVIETVVISAVIASIFTVTFAKTRNLDARTAFTWYLASMVKFGVFHILAQLSGVYTIIFSMHK
jgi:hypothetical protein